MCQGIDYGDIRGFKGVNCRHDWYPFFEGISTRAYADKQLEELKNSDLYDRQQEQRGIEREIRRTKRELAGLDAAMKNASPEVAETLKQDFDSRAVKLKAQEAKLRQHCKDNGLLQDSSRVQTQYGKGTTEGFGRSTAQKAVWAEKKIYPRSAESVENHQKYRYNYKKDYKQWNGYKELLGQNAPATLVEFQQIKYSDLWNSFKAYSKSIQTGELSTLVGFDLYKAKSAEIDNVLVGITTENGLVVTGKSSHFIARILGAPGQRRSGVDVLDARQALLHPGKIDPVKVDKNGKSQRFRGNACYVTINPETGCLIQANPHKGG